MNTQGPDLSELNKKLNKLKNDNQKLETVQNKLEAEVSLPLYGSVSYTSTSVTQNDIVTLFLHS